MKSIPWVALAFLASLPLLAQTAKPEFEVASIKRSETPTEPSVNVGVHVDGAQCRVNYFSLKDLVRVAYRVKDYQVLGPDWIASERFDVSATIPAGAPRDQVNDMLQSLLEQRFGLKIHRDHKEFPVYALVTTKGGPKMKETVESDSDKADAAKAPVEVEAQGGPSGVGINLGHGSSFTFADNKFQGTKIDMTRVAEMLSRFLDRPVVDMTELKGKYDFKLELTPEDYRAMLIRSAIAAGVVLPPQALQLLDGATDASLHSALAGIGLKLDPRKAPLEVIVVDHAEKTPTAN